MQGLKILKKISYEKVIINYGDVRVVDHDKLSRHC